MTVSRHGIIKIALVALCAAAVSAPATEFPSAQASVANEPQAKGLRSFLRRHPRIRKAAKAGAIGAGIGTGVGLVTGGSVAGSAASSAGRSAGFSLVRTSKPWQKAKSKVVSNKRSKKQVAQSEHGEPK